MSALVTDVEVTPASLIPEKGLPKGLPGLGRIGQRYSPGLQRVAKRSVASLVAKFAEFGMEGLEVTPQDADITSFANWCDQETGNSVLLHYRAAPIVGGIVAVIPVDLVNQLVDIHFGGTGEADHRSDNFSPAERLFLNRFAEDFIPALTAPWSNLVKLESGINKISMEGNHAGLFKPHELVTVQPYKLQASTGDAMQITLLYPVSGLRAVPALTDADGISSSAAIDPVWYDSLNEAVMQVGMPLRTVFARPEISLEQLMSLKSGDVLPIFMPNRIPLSISGRLFAHGTVGESNNRVAVQIEEIEKGN